MSKEAMKLALEALETIAGAMPFPVGKSAIAALREALAEQPYPENFIDALKYDAAKRDFWEGYVPEPDKRQQALDKKADNARELGLDYEPALTKILNNPEGFCPGNFDTPERANAFLMGLCQEAATEIKRLNKAVADEREACAKVCDIKAEVMAITGKSCDPDDLAAAIRARGNT